MKQKKSYSENNNDFKTDYELELEKEQKTLDKIGDLASYFREYPHLFAKHYLNVDLHPFQDILLYEMFHNDFSNIVACRGLGKTWIIALYAVIKAILYPGSQICVTSSKLKQAIEVLKKIQLDFCIKHEWGSDLLNLEIKKILLSAEDPQIIFYNGSVIYAVAANQNARSKRSTDNIYDEYVQMDPDIIDDILQPFLTSKRRPGFVSNPKYENCVEENKEIYASSAWYSGEWSYIRAQDYIINMLIGKKYFACALPYQLSLEANITSKSRIEAVMDRSDFDPVKFSMEYEALWFGSDGTEFLSFEAMNNRRNITQSLPPLEILLDKRNKIKVDPIIQKGKRVLSVDVALIQGDENDAAVLMINDAILQENNQFVSNFRLIETFEGLRTEQLGLIVMRMYYLYNCDVLVVDGRGNGQGVLDNITIEQFDSLTGLTYLPFKAVNNDKWVERAIGSKFTNSLWVINATNKLNDEAAYRLKNGFENNKINLLVSEYDCEKHLESNISGYLAKKDAEQMIYKKPFVETTLTINEIVKLEFELKGQYVSPSEASGMRKDRYSSMSYNYWVVKELEKTTKPRQQRKKITFKSRKPVYR